MKELVKYDEYCTLHLLDESLHSLVTGALSTGPYSNTACYNTGEAGNNVCGGYGEGSGNTGCYDASYSDYNCFAVNEVCWGHMTPTTQNYTCVRNPVCGSNIGC